MQVKKQKLEPNIKQRTGLKLGKEYVKAVYCLYIIVYCVYIYIVHVYVIVFIV